MSSESVQRADQCGIIRRTPENSFTFLLQQQEDIRLSLQDIKARQPRLVPLDAPRIDSQVAQYIDDRVPKLLPKMITAEVLRVQKCLSALAPVPVSASAPALAPLPVVVSSPVSVVQPVATISSAELDEKIKHLKALLAELAEEIEDARLAVETAPQQRKSIKSATLDHLLATQVSYMQELEHVQAQLSECNKVNELRDDLLAEIEDAKAAVQNAPPTRKSIKQHILDSLLEQLRQMDTTQQATPSRATPPPAHTTPPSAHTTPPPAHTTPPSAHTTPPPLEHKYDPGPASLAELYPAPVQVQASTSAPTQWEPELRQLSELGYTDVPFNVEMLKKCHGDVRKVIDILFSQHDAVEEAIKMPRFTVPEKDPIAILERCGFTPFDYSYNTSAVNHIKSILRDKERISAQELAQDVWHFEPRYNSAGTQEWRARVAWQNFEGDWTSWHLVKTQATEESAISALVKMQKHPRFKNLFLRKLPNKNDPNTISAVTNALRDKSSFKHLKQDDRYVVTENGYICRIMYGDTEIGKRFGKDKTEAKTNASLDCLERWTTAMKVIEGLPYETLKRNYDKYLKLP